MAFPNKLVQPECGAPNPLVAAARHITNPRPSTSTATRPMTTSRQHDFAQEFMKMKLSGQQPQTVVVSSSAVADLTTSSRPTSTNASMQWPAAQHQHQQQDNRMMATAASLAAGPYLGNAVRYSSGKLATDFLSEQETMIKEDGDDVRGEKEEGKLDDVEFWQSLSQKYNGPPSVDAASYRRLTVTEYQFDERNPLQNQFEDPFAEGLKRLELGDIPSAALLFEAAVQKDPTNAIAWRYLGTTQAQNEKDMAAIRALTKCLSIDQGDQQARLAISVSLANETYHHEACNHLIEWLTRHEKYRTVGASVEEFNAIADEMFDGSPGEKHHSYVRDKFFQAARMSPNDPDPEVQSSLGVLFNMRGEYDKAVDCFKAALSVRSDDSILWNRLGATLANGNKSDEAVIAYRKALEISPGFLRTRYNLAITLVQLNTYDEAARQLVQILNMQAAGRGGGARSTTSTSIWNTLRTVATLLNRTDLYPPIDGKDLESCNKMIFKK